MGVVIKNVSVKKAFSLDERDAKSFLNDSIVSTFFSG
jgi:hypothetical protein